MLRRRSAASSTRGRRPARARSPRRCRQHCPRGTRRAVPGAGRSPRCRDLSRHRQGPQAPRGARHRRSPRPARAAPSRSPRAGPAYRAECSSGLPDQGVEVRELAPLAQPVEHLVLVVRQHTAQLPGQRRLERGQGGAALLEHVRPTGVRLVGLAGFLGVWLFLRLLRAKRIGRRGPRRGPLRRSRLRRLGRRGCERRARRRLRRSSGHRGRQVSPR